MVAQIYDQFVAPTAKGVDPETCRGMVKEFLIACKRHMPLLAKQSMDAGLKFGAMMSVWLKSVISKHNYRRRGACMRKKCPTLSGMKAAALKHFLDLSVLLLPSASIVTY